MNAGQPPRSSFPLPFPPRLPFPLPGPFAAFGTPVGETEGSVPNGGGSSSPLPPLSEMAAGLGARLPTGVGLGLGTAVLERVTLLLNHVLCSEPEAMSRLAPHAGRRLLVVWSDWPAWLPLPASAAWRITPPGLLDLDTESTDADAPVAAEGDLTVLLDTRAVLGWAVQAPLAAPGGRPPMSIQGDAELAAAVAWLAEHLRWDIEEDLARIVGDAPAHLIGRVSRGLAEALQRLLAPLRR